MVQRYAGGCIGWDEYYVHTDHLGTPRIITDGNTVIWRWESDPFGATTAQEDPDGDLTDFTYNLRFPGQYYDTETGLHYNYFRTYDPSTGRYLQSDPSGLNGGLNTYGYVGGNPLSAIDPLGLDLVLVGEPDGLGRMLNLAAQTWDAENCGCNEIVEVGSGDQAVEAMESYAKTNGGIDGLRVFAHSGPNGIFFVQMNTYRCHFVKLFLLAVALAACSPSPEEIHKGMLESEDMDQFQRFVGKAQELGADAIPIYLDVLDKSLEEPAKLLNYGKTGTCIQKLHELAVDGVFEIQEVPVLLRALDEQLAIGDTLPTAETLRIITGVDVGYDAAFVANYKVEDEERRQEMISAWRSWYANNASRADPGLN